MKTRRGKRAIDLLPRDKNVFEGTKALQILEKASRPKKPKKPKVMATTESKPNFFAHILSVFRR